MDLEFKSKLLKAIDSAPDDKRLAEYLLKVSKYLNPTRYVDSTITMQDSIKKLMDDIAPRFTIELKNKQVGSLSEFYYLTSGLHVIGAPSGHGKTFWAMKWAEDAAKQDNEVLVLSLEMNHSDLASRTISEITDLPLIKIVRRDLNQTQKILIKDLADSDEYKYFKKIHIDTFGDYDWVKIYPRLIDRMVRLKPKLVIIDYVQMISNSETDDLRSSKILNDIARELKLFADQTDAAVLLLSQLNREAIKEIKSSKLNRVEFIPLSHDNIKESGGIVEAADSVQMVCIPGRLDLCPDHLKNTFQVSITKSRRIGLLGTKLFPFDYKTMKFI